MARISQYKALGTSLGGYKKSQSELQSKEYAKRHSDWKAQEQKALYGEIGGTVANIIGITQEMSRLNELKQYGEQAKDLSGIGQREVDYQPLGGFGEAIGLGPRKRTEYFARESGKVLSEASLQNIGKAESLGIDTKYSQFQLVDPKAPVPTRPDTSKMSVYGEQSPAEKAVFDLDKNEQIDIFGRELPKDEDVMGRAGIESTEDAYQRSLMEGDLLYPDLPTEESLSQMKEQMKEDWWKGTQGKEETPLEVEKATTTIQDLPQAGIERGVSEAAYPVERDVRTPLSVAMSDVAVSDDVKLREMGIVPTDWTKREPISSPRTTVPSDRTAVSVEDMLMGRLGEEDTGIFSDIAGLSGAEGLSKFEQEIAMSENPKYFMGDESAATYMDIDTSTGKDRPAEGYGIARGEGTKTRAEHNKALQVHIHESQKSAQKLIGPKVWNKLPEEKRQVLTELIYQMGPSRIQKFPRFLGAMVVGDFDKAARELLYTKEGKPSDWSQKGGRDRVKRIIKKLSPTTKVEDRQKPLYAGGG